MEGELQRERISVLFCPAVPLLFTVPHGTLGDQEAPTVPTTKTLEGTQLLDLHR